MRQIVVTGANKGIGLAIVSEILDQQDDTFVFLGTRDLDRGQAALQTLTERNDGWAERISVLPLDVSDDTSVAAAAEQIARTLGGSLYAIVNNAGIGLGSADSRAVLEVNTLGVRRVCEAFLPLLDPKRGRIVNITSASGPNFVSACSPERQRFLIDPEITWASLEAFIAECLAIEGGRDAFAAAGLGDGNAYGLSKACANAYTLLLARENPTLRVNACTPGFIETDMTRHYAAAKGVSPAQMGMKPPKEGTTSAMFLLFDEPEANGRYYGSDGKRSPLHRYRSPGTPPYSGD